MSTHPRAESRSHEPVRHPADRRGSAM